MLCPPAGIVFENMARQRQQKEGRWAFLSGGEGAAYYRWKVRLPARRRPNAGLSIRVWCKGAGARMPRLAAGVVAPGAAAAGLESGEG